MKNKVCGLERWKSSVLWGLSLHWHQAWEHESGCADRCGSYGSVQLRNNDHQWPEWQLLLGGGHTCLPTSLWAEVVEHLYCYTSLSFKRNFQFSVVAPWNTNFSLFHLCRSEDVKKESATAWGKMYLPQHSLGISSKGCSQKHQQGTSWCWLHVTTSPSWDRAVTPSQTPWQLNIHYLVLVGLQPRFFFSSLGYFRTTGTFVSL